MTGSFTRADLIGFFEDRGFFGRSAPAYNGLAGVFDYGPLGAEVKRRLAAAWWRQMILERDDVEGIDAALLTQPELLHYSGHIMGYDEDLFRCSGCKVVGKESQMKAHECSAGPVSTLQWEGRYNLLFASQIGIGTDTTECYLRPATAQHSYANFNRLMSFRNEQLPLGIAQIGKAFRNEIMPDNYPCRMREFEQMELQFFIHPSEEQRWLDYWINERMSWWEKQGIPRSRLTMEEVPESDLALYSRRTVDIYFNSDQFDRFEIEGIANRSDFDLRCHQQGGLVPDACGLPEGTINTASTIKTATQDRRGNHFFCSAIEPAAGLDRGVFAVLLASYHEERSEVGWRRTLRLPRHLSPRDLTMLVTDDIEQETATSLKRKLLRTADLKIAIEQTQLPEQAVIQEDERGTSLTAWFEDNKITVRDRDTCRVTCASIGNAHALLLATIFQETDAGAGYDIKV